MYNPMELIGRYVLTGIILFGALFIMMAIRMLYMAFKPGADSFAVLNAMQSAVDENEKGKNKWWSLTIELVLWPWGVIRAVHTYMKLENKVIEKLNEKGS